MWVKIKSIEYIRFDLSEETNLHRKLMNKKNHLKKSTTQIKSLTGL